MNLQFTNNLDKSFSLGTVSATFLDQNNIFDSYQEDHDETSEIIFCCTKPESLKGLSKDIKEIVKTPNLRDDIRNKLLNFSDFLSESETVTAIIA